MGANGQLWPSPFTPQKVVHLVADNKLLFLSLAENSYKTRWSHMNIWLHSARSLARQMPPESTGNLIYLQGLCKVQMSAFLWNVLQIIIRKCFVTKTSSVLCFANFSEVTYFQGQKRALEIITMSWNELECQMFRIISKDYNKFQVVFWLWLSNQRSFQCVYFRAMS